MASRPLNNGYLLNTPLDFNGTLPSLNFPADPAGLVRTEIDDDLGIREFVLVKNDGVTDIALGDCLVFVDDAKTLVRNFTDAAAGGLSVGAALNRAAGVAIGAITVGNWGWIQTKGLHTSVKANGAVLNGQMLTLDNTANTMVVPVALGTAAPYTVVGVATRDLAGTIRARLTL